MPGQPFEVMRPQVLTSGVVFASPHSGRDYPWSFLRRTVLDERMIRSSEDAFVDRLFEHAPQLGAPLIKANAPRAWIDLNRAADEMDPALVQGVRRSAHNPRVASGLGVVPRVVAGGRAIYRGKLTLEEANARVTEVWRPYHDTLQELLNTARAQFGEAVLVDCHSMPHEALDTIASSGAKRPDIVLGDRFGASASGEIVDRVEAAFAAEGLHVVRNTPFAGAYSTQHYGRPSKGQHAVQIEIDRSIYMDEALVRPNANFHPFRKLLRGIIAEIVEIGRPRITSMAAE
ncbi:N-formylglutamate amidohydrolase [Pseudaestuariivita sp.]|uniref:N-formylglutamate amidohydrolase n=1 Tax=Pseudaestuariivita sp. TaxID=2211669 RepID=UPI004057E7CB